MKRSAKRCTGAFEASACSTSRTIWPNVVSRPTRSVLTRSAPRSQMVAANTWSPGCFSTGTDSPVIGGLVHAGSSVHHRAVHRDPLARLDHDDLSARDLFRRDLDFMPVALDPGGVRREREQLADRLARSFGRVALDEVGETHEEDDHGGRRILPDRDRAHDPKRHQRMGRHAPVPQRAHDIAEDRIASGQNRGQGEPRREYG